MRLRHPLSLATSVIGLALVGAGQSLGQMGPRGPGNSASARVEVVDDTNASYEDWVNDAISKLSGDDANAQNQAADQLAEAVVYAPVRGEVLAALEPHINSSDSRFRLRCVKAYGHWATAAQVQQLLGVVAFPAHPPNMSGAEPCWAAAVTALISLDPKAAQGAMEYRTDSFFFRTDMVTALRALAAAGGTCQPVAYDMLKQLNPGDEGVQLAVSDALQLLQSDAASDRIKAAKSLAYAVVDPSERPDVLAGLKPHVMGSSGGARLPFVQAFAHWATLQDVPGLQAIIAYPAEVSGLSGHEDCWAAATVGLARLDVQAAADATKSRASYFFYRTSMHRFLEPVAEGNGPESQTAAWLLNLVESGNGRPPLPPDFNVAPSPTLPATPAIPPSPANPADMHTPPA